MVNLNEDVIWTGPGLYTVIWTGWLTKTNLENINVKYNIVRYMSLLIFFFVIPGISYLGISFGNHLWVLRTDGQSLALLTLGSDYINLRSSVAGYFHLKGKYFKHKTIYLCFI